ncbi:MAG: hypothetical protein JNM84_06040 [Planctomycetes bacterium]|nr:hypothetical protein [Planctomycetota bacterium]
MLRHALCWPLFTSLAALGLRAQEPASSALPESVTKTLSTAADWLRPIHGAVDDPQAAEYGLWASGPDYKVSFGRAIGFYPLRGEAGENAPLYWKTRSIRVGAQELLSASASADATHTDWRYELHHGAVDEIYDVRSAGVEQSFRLHERPPVVGDLIIEGEITGPLGCAEQEPAHRELDFGLGADRALVRYGAAIAIDAAGRSTPVLSSFANGAIRLQLAGEWLAEASFPLVVDPLLTRRDIQNGAFVGGVDIAVDELHHHFLVARERLFAIGDYDLYSTVVSSSGLKLSDAFEDIAAGWSTLHASGTHVLGAHRWVLAFERLFAAPAGSNVYAYIQDEGSVAPAGVVRQVASALGVHERYPSVGGTADHLDEEALIVYQEDQNAAVIDTDESRVRGAMLDVQARTFAPSFAISIDSPGHDCERPSVNRRSGGIFDPWLVVYAQWNAANANDDWDIIGRKVSADETLSGREIVAAALAGEHALWPKVEGAGGRFLVVHGALANAQKAYGETFSTIRAQRVDWDLFAAAPSFPHPRRMLRTAASNRFGFGRPASRSVAFNHDTRSHWGIGWIEDGRSLRCVRTGFDVGIVEDATVYSVASEFVRGFGACYDPTLQTFALAFGVNDVADQYPVYKQDLGFQNAFNLTFGAGCEGTIEARGTLNGPSAPYAGSEFFSITLDNGVAFAPTALLIAPLPGALPIGNGCTLLLDAATFFMVGSGVTNAVGDFGVQMPLPTTPIYEFDVYWQWFQLDPVSGQPRLSNGLRTFVR